MGFKNFKNKEEKYKQQKIRKENIGAGRAIMYKYGQFKSASKIPIIDASVDGKSTFNPAQPTPADFICDVDIQIKKAITDKETAEKFKLFYITGVQLLTKPKITSLEEKMGAIFKNVGFYNKEDNTGAYFTFIRK